MVQVMELVELEGLANSIVGRPGISGLSVEQRKRLTIAVELVANPSIIFMVRPSASRCRCLYQSSCAPGEQTQAPSGVTSTPKRHQGRTHHVQPLTGGNG